MVDVLSIVVNAAALGALYSLIAIGFTMIYGVGGVLNFAYGGQVTAGAFGAYHVVQILGGNVWIGLVGGMLAASLVGILLYFGAVRFCQDEAIAVLVITFLSGFTLEYLFRTFYTTDTITISLFFEGNSLLLGQRIQHNMVFIFVSSWIIIGLLGVFVTRTTTGKAIIAMSNSKRGAQLVGIRKFRMNLYTWGIGGLFAGFAGVIILSFRGGAWNMGLDPLLLAFSIVILGGLGSIKGSVIGAYIIGTFEVLIISLIDASLLGVASLVVLLVVLTVRPQGLFGREAVGDF